MSEWVQVSCSRVTRWLWITWFKGSRWIVRGNPYSVVFVVAFVLSNVMSADECRQHYCARRKMYVCEGCVCLYIRRCDVRNDPHVLLCVAVQ